MEIIFYMYMHQFSPSLSLSSFCKFRAAQVDITSPTYKHLPQDGTVFPHVVVLYLLKFHQSCLALKASLPFFTLYIPTEHRCRTSAQRRTFPVGDIYEGQGRAMGRTQDEVENSGLSVNVLQWLRQSTDLAMTLSSVCLCAF